MVGPLGERKMEARRDKKGAFDQLPVATEERGLERRLRSQITATHLHQLVALHEDADCYCRLAKAPHDPGAQLVGLSRMKRVRRA